MTCAIFWINIWLNGVLRNCLSMQYQNQPCGPCTCCNALQSNNEKNKLKLESVLFVCCNMDNQSFKVSDIHVHVQYMYVLYVRFRVFFSENKTTP